MRVDVRQTMKQKVVDAFGHARGQRSTEVESEKKTVCSFQIHRSHNFPNHLWHHRHFGNMKKEFCQLASYHFLFPPIWHHFRLEKKMIMNKKNNCRIFHIFMGNKSKRFSLNHLCQHLHHKTVQVVPQSPPHPTRIRRAHFLFRLPFVPKQHNNNHKPYQFSLIKLVKLIFLLS